MPRLVNTPVLFKRVIKSFPIVLVFTCKENYFKQNKWRIWPLLVANSQYSGVPSIGHKTTRNDKYL